MRGMFILSIELQTEPKNHKQVINHSLPVTLVKASKCNSREESVSQNQLMWFHPRIQRQSRELSEGTESWVALGSEDVTFVISNGNSKR